MKYSVRPIEIYGKALVYRGNSELICYRKGKLIFYNVETNEKMRIIRLPLSLWKRFFCFFRITERLLHIDVRWAIQIDERYLLVQFNHDVLKVDILNSIIKKEEIMVKGNPLSIEKVEDILGFENQYVVGDYTKNSNREAVNLYGRDSNGKWDIVWSFPAGTVRHIHGCFSDRENDCVYILTGDEDDESGIWKATNNFQRVEPLLVGRQQYRACQMMVIGSELFYFTDAPSQTNYVYWYKEGIIKKIDRLKGTCIYGTNSEDVGYYSTTCEPNAHAKNRLDYWLSNKSGEGIVGKNVEVFAIDNKGKIIELATFEHDGLPLRLFQYGTVTFSNVINEKAFFTPLCVKKYDMKVFEISCCKSDVE